MKSRFNLALDRELYTWTKEYAKENKTSVTSLITGCLLKMKNKETRLKVDMEKMDILKKFAGKVVNISVEGEIKELEPKTDI